MPRPPGVHPATSADNSAGNAGGNAGNVVIDAAVSARAGLTITRSFTLADLPRLRQAGAYEGSQVTARFHFLQFDGRIAIKGHLQGVVKLTCQRCVQEVDVPLDDRFDLVLVDDEAELAANAADEDKWGGYEPIEGDPSRLDLQLLAEDQTLLALPLVPSHESEDCAAEASVATDVARRPEVVDKSRQRPFENLRDLLRKQ